MVPVVEAICEVDALVAILFVIRRQRGQDSQFNPRCVAVFLYRADDLDRAHGLLLLVIRFDHLPKGPLTEKSDDGI